MKRRLKQLLGGLGILLAVVLLGLWLARNAIANSVMNEAVPRLVAKAADHGVILHDLNHDEAKVTSPVRVKIPGVEVGFDLGVKNRNQLRSQFQADTVGLKLAGLFPPKARLELENFRLGFHPEDLPQKVPFESFDEARFLSAPLPITDPEACLRQVMSGLRALFEENSLVRDFELSGKVELELGEHGRESALLYTETLPDEAKRLRFDKEDLRQIAKQTKVVISEDELEILSVYPLRAPVIMLITARAKAGSVERRLKDASFPEDAFRHLTWSFQLTRAFGPDFAKQVTDAHETLPNNTEAERAMDYHNNALAREWAMSGMEASEISRLLMEDSRAILAPE
ncbi:DUF6973 domain-containing protein [Haloferula chungangensis]|uniref:DUF6973 domain-containing protein n=1 Tax=Haloferula chungangensis TaxID=1048331 RepID=A0ABW2L190_9BACT